ncbi:MAG: arylsulfatase family protein [Verrucomicrobiales bacterium]|nr:arylsulfatase family protein [Verrucomicrobiales bacterium]
MRSRRCLFLSLLPILLSCAFVRAAEKPDIVFILSDDQGSYDVGWRGSEIKTPNLDKLARAGARLENFYVQPLCSPTRAALMTGRYPMRYGLQVGVILPDADFGLPLEERMLPQALHEVGYTTAICGKWHLGSLDKTYWPDHRGFDHWYGMLFGMTDYFKHTRTDKLDWWRNGKLSHDEGYTTELIGREAVTQIRNQAKDKPLFLYVPFNAVHYPFQAPEKYKEPYAALKDPRRTYAGMIAAMDEAIGKIVAAIDETGRRKNTLFIFSSDNGGYKPGTVTSNGPLRGGKGSVYEGGVHTCAFATWENHIKPGSAVNAMAHMVDWYPTLLNLTGASLKQKLPLDGKDIWPCVTEGKPSPHHEILFNSTPTTGAIRVGDWKLVLHGKQDGAEQRGKGKKRKRNADAGMNIELFNLAEDLSEKKNLADENPKKLKELRSRYDALASQAVPPKNQNDKEP